MSEFDVNQFLNARFAGTLKAFEVSATAEQKTQELLKKKAESDAYWEQRRKQDAQIAGSWQGNNESLWGQTKNLAASMVSGASRDIGHLITNIYTPLTTEVMESLTQADIDAYNRHMAGTATSEDRALLAQPSSAGYGMTTYGAIEEFKKANQNAQAIAKTMDRSDLVNPTRKNRAMKDIQDRYNRGVEQLNQGDVVNTLGGAATLLGAFSDTAVSHPGAIMESIAENAPQFIMALSGGARGKAAMMGSNAGYGAASFQEGMAERLKTSNGQLPSKETINDMFIKAGSLVAAETAGDLIGLHGAKAIGKALKGSGSKAATESTTKSFKDAMRNIGKGAAEGLIGETPTEAYQTAIEENLKGKKASGAEIFTGGVIGGLSGGGMSGGIRAPGEIAGWLANKPMPKLPGAVKDTAGKLKETQAVQAEVKKALDTGDISALVSLDSPTYAPDRAIGVLFGRTQQNMNEGADNLNRAEDILEGMGLVRRVLAATLKTPEEIQASIDRNQAKMD